MTNLDYAAFWVVFTHPLISKSSSPFINSLLTLPRTPITIGITVTFKFKSVFISQARSWYLSFFSLSFKFTLWSAGTAKFTIMQVLFFCYYNIWSSSRDLVIRLYFKIPGVYVSHSPGKIVGCTCIICSHRQTSVSWTIDLDTQSCQVLYSFCANLLHYYLSL